jgi:hypothetical protein
MSFDILPLELFRSITKSLGQKTSSLVCKKWKENYDIIFENPHLFKSYWNQFDLTNFCNKTSIQLFKKFNYFDIYGLEIIKMVIYDIIVNINNKLYENILRYDNIYVLKYFSTIFEHNIISNTDNDIKIYLNDLCYDSIGGYLLEMFLDGEFYNSSKFLLGKGVSSMMYLHGKTESKETRKIMVNQLEFLAKYKSLNLGWLEYHIFRERSYKNMDMIPTGYYLADMIHILDKYLPEETKNIILKSYNLHLLFNADTYTLEINKDSYASGYMTRYYKVSGAFAYIIVKHVEYNVKTSLELFNDFKFFIDNYMVDLPSFYMTLNLEAQKYISKFNDNPDKINEFIGYVKNMIHNDILVYM